jgi:hypothetical protein
MSVLQIGNMNGTGNITVPQPHTPQEAEKLLTGQPAFTEGYRPTIPYWGMGDEFARQSIYLLNFDIPWMLMHSHVKLVYDQWKSAIDHAEFKIVANSPEVKRYVEIMLTRFWERSLTQVQSACDYGWGGYELCYGKEKGYLTYSHMWDFSPFDVHVLTRHPQRT